MNAKRRTSAPRRLATASRGEGATTAPPPGRTSNIPTSKPLQARSVLVPHLHQLVAEADLDSALALAEALLRTAADAEIAGIAARCRRELDMTYVARLGGWTSVVQVEVPPSRWLELDLDPRECFLLAHLDDASTLETIVDISGIPAHEALRILCGLFERRLIRVR